MPHPYCTPQQVQARMPQVRTWGQGNVPSTTDIADMIEENDDLIDSYLATRFECPFDTAPDSIRRISRDLTVADVRELIYGDSVNPDTLGPGIRKRAMEQCMGLANGIRALDPESVAQADTAAGDDRRAEGSWPATAEPTFQLDDEF